MKKLPNESQRNATIMHLVENFNRQKAAAQQGQPNSIKPPSLPSQITDLDKYVFYIFILILFYFILKYLYIFYFIFILLNYFILF